MLQVPVQIICSVNVMPDTFTDYLTKTLSALKPGSKYQQPLPPVSADAYYLTQLHRAAGRPIAVFCAEPQAALRLLNESRQFNPKLNIHLFPDWETLPYDSFSPHQDLISERLLSLYSLMNRQVDILLIPVTTALYRLAPAEFLAAYAFSFNKGQTLDVSALQDQLVTANYSNVPQVTHPGEFSIRGSLIDLFPMGSALPYRLDLFDDEIESIKSFDIDTQRSLYPVDSIQLLPGREYPFDEEAIARFRAAFREKFEGDPTKSLPYKDITQGIAFTGVEYYLPLFFEETSTLFDYLTEDTLAVCIGNLDESIQQFNKETTSRYAFLKSDPEKPVLPPAELFLSQEQFYTVLKGFSRLDLVAGDANEYLLKAPDVAVLKRSETPFTKLKSLVDNAAQEIILCAESAGRKETLLEVLREHELQPETPESGLEDLPETASALSLITAPINAGFEVKEQNLIILTENDLYPESSSGGSRKRRRQESQTNIEAIVRDLAELREGDPVVHATHGIGRYCGLVNMTMNDTETEMLKLEYANDSTLYVPVSQLHLISRYAGADPESAPLHTLGSGQWEKARKKAAKQVRDTAAELLLLYAHRQSREGVKFNLTETDYRSFAESFEYELTPDQAAAINSVIADMTSGQPMDRLVCGDVGFGKTEVALRAAFICVANGMQVAMLCPTTLLAEQHAQTFRDRFAQWPIKIAELSRFRASKEVNATVEGLADGSVDIVIGTHKLLSKNTQFKRLGLVIIDEEHRFGVRQKEALKGLRTEVDVLTLTATPIPRTLGMSLDGIRDFSVIATAPQKRLAIKTFVRREDNSTIREAVLRELKRGGQVYFLHNEVDTIYNRKAQLEELLPEARIGVAHGQMPERELEHVMKGFYQQRYNVLLCTTIIETGIDVPTANTIIIHRADRLGLAQLHQLRGRVGRSHHQAYAYLLNPGKDGMTPSAKKRLEAIQSMEELGSGFYLAMHDLEIRGTGEILGESQSGNIREVGFNMYTDMLHRAIKALKKGQELDFESPFDLGCDVKLDFSALLPNDYCPDINMRLGFYKNLSNAQDVVEISDIQEEIIDRLGVMPVEAKALVSSHRLRILAEPLGITQIEINSEKAQLSFKENSKVDPVTLMMLVNENKHINFKGPTKIQIGFKEGLAPEARLQQTMTVLKKLNTVEKDATVN